MERNRPAVDMINTHREREREREREVRSKSKRMELYWRTAKHRRVGGIMFL